jgi:hypothetical protein
MAVQSAAVGTVSPGSFTVGALGFSAPNPYPNPQQSQPATAERRAYGRADDVLTLEHLSAAKLLTPANEGDPMAATALTPQRVNHLIPSDTEEPR